MLTFINTCVSIYFMIFRDFAERLLGSKVKVKMLKYLLPVTPFSAPLSTSERELARLCGVSNAAVNHAFRDFYDLGLVGPMSVGGSNVWQLKVKSHAFEVLSKPLADELLRRSALARLESEIRLILSGEVNAGRLRQAVIYGSIAEGKEKDDSDIDLLLLIDSKKSEDKVRPAVEELDAKCRELFGNVVSPYFIVYGTLDSQPAWVKKVLSTGIKVMMV